MSMTDPISDMLTRLRNGQRAKHAYVDIPHSKVKEKIINVLLEEGYVSSQETILDEDGIAIFPKIRVRLKYTNGVPVIRRIQRVSKPGRRIYKKNSDIGYFYGGLGTYIISTSKGILSDYNARKLNVGGEVICKLF